RRPADRGRPGRARVPGLERHQRAGDGGTGAPRRWRPARPGSRAASGAARPGHRPRVRRGVGGRLGRIRARQKRRGPGRMSAAGPAPSDRSELHAPLLLRRWAPFAVLAGVLVLAAIASVVAWRQYDDGRNRALNDVRAKVFLTNAVLGVYFNGALSTLTS